MSTFILHDRFADPESGRISSYFSQLFLVIGQESVYFSTLDTEKSTFISLAEYRMADSQKAPEHYTAMLDQFLSQESTLLKKYPAAVISIDTLFHTLVPSSFFDREQLMSYLLFNYRIPDGYMAGFDQVEELGASNVYGFQPALMEILRKHFRDAAIVHRSTALMKAFSQVSPAYPFPSALFMHMSDTCMHLACFTEQRPVFFNSFPAQSKEDILYFILYTIEQLKLRPDAVPLLISGMIDPDSDSIKFLRHYVPHTELTMPLPSFNYAAMLKQAPLHRYLDLFVLALCGS
jgi:hypothetical protein